MGLSGAGRRARDSILGCPRTVMAATWVVFDCSPPPIQPRARRPAPLRLGRLRPKNLLTGTKSRIFLFLSLGAGVTPAEGSVKPTAGFTFNRVYRARRYSRIGITTYVYC